MKYEINDEILINDDDDDDVAIYFLYQILNNVSHVCNNFDRFYKVS